MDEGCGKGYLTFAAHELLKKKSQAALDVVGVERREEHWSEACNWACRDDAGLSFMAGDIAPQGKVDVVVALHACDTATDDALHAAVLGGARAIVAAPCCHKQLRPQLERHRKGSEADPAAGDPAARRPRRPPRRGGHGRDAVFGAGMCWV